jgi:hypothetical protein
MSSVIRRCVFVLEAQNLSKDRMALHIKGQAVNYYWTACVSVLVSSAVRISNLLKELYYVCDCSCNYRVCANHLYQ